MKKFLLLIFCSFSLCLSSQDEISLNLNFSEKKVDYLATVIVQDGYVYAATRQRDIEIDNEVFLGLQITKMSLQGDIIWADSLYSSDIDEIFLAEEENMIIFKEHIYSIYSIISPSSEKEFLFNKHTLDGELVLSKRIPINGELSLVSGIVSFSDQIYVIQESSPSKMELLEFDQNLVLIDSEAILAPIGNDISLFSSEDYLILSFSSWNNINVEFNCRVYDKDLNTIEIFNDFPITEIFSKIAAISCSDGGYIFSWSNDLSESLFDTFPYPTVVYKYDSELEKEWEYTFVHKSAKQFIGTIETEEGNIFGYGISDELYTFDIEPSPLNAYSGWCFLLSSEGKLLWERAIFDQRYMLLNGFYSGFEYENQFILAGLIDEYDQNSDPVNDPSSWLFSIDKEGCWNGNCEEIIIIDSDSISYTDIENVTTPHIQIYPNPATVKLRIETSYEQFQLQLINASGNYLISEEISTPSYSLNIEKYPPGYYYILVTSSNSGQKYIRKIVIY